MDKVVYFLEQAHECLEMAERAKDQTVRDQLEHLARKWTDLAVEREQMVKETLPKAPSGA